MSRFNVTVGQRPTLRPHALTLTVLLCLGGTQAATTFSRSPYQDAKAEIRAAYQAEKSACAPMSGKARGDCVASAKARFKGR